MANDTIAVHPSTQENDTLGLVGSVSTNSVGVLVVSRSVRSSHGSGLTGSNFSGDGLATAQGTSLSKECLHGKGWLDGSLVDNWFLVDDLVDWDGGVNDLLLDDLSLDDWLDGLVNVVVGNILTDSSNGGSLDVGWEDGLGVLVCVLLSSKGLLGTLTHLVCAFSVLYGNSVVLVNLSVDDSVSDRLHSLLVVVDVVLSVLDYLGLLSDSLGDGLLDDSWCNGLVSLGGSNSAFSEKLSGGSWDAGASRGVCVGGVVGRRHLGINCFFALIERNNV